MFPWCSVMFQWRSYYVLDELKIYFPYSQLHLQYHLYFHARLMTSLSITFWRAHQSHPGPFFPPLPPPAPVDKTIFRTANVWARELTRLLIVGFYNIVIQSAPNANWPPVPDAPPLHLAPRPLNAPVMIGVTSPTYVQCYIVFARNFLLSNFNKVRAQRVERGQLCRLFVPTNLKIRMGRLAWRDIWKWHVFRRRHEVRTFCVASQTSYGRNRDAPRRNTPINNSLGIYLFYLNLRLFFHLHATRITRCHVGCISNVLYLFFVDNCKRNSFAMYFVRFT